MEYSDILNKLTVIKEDGAMYFLKRSAILYYVSQKSSYLDKNSFQLLECKKSLTEEEFKFITSKYKEQLTFIISATEWLEENVSTFIDNVDNDIKISFNIQRETVLKHAEKVNQITKFQIQLNPKDQSLEELLDTNQELLKNVLQNSKTSINVESKQPTSPKRKKKTKPITNEEAEQYLIDTIFKSVLTH